MNVVQTPCRILEREHFPVYNGKRLPLDVEVQREFLTPICGYSRVISVQKTDGSLTLRNSGLFSFVGDGYEKFGFNIPTNIETKCQRLVVGEQAKDGTAGQVIRVVRNIQKRVFQQSQVVEICRHFLFLLRDNDPISTFFPVVKEGTVADDLSNVYLLSVFPQISGWGTNLWSITEQRVLSAKNKARFIFLY